MMDGSKTPPQSSPEKPGSGQPEEDDELTVEEQLDEALEESFPASDTPSVTRYPQEEDDD